MLRRHAEDLLARSEALIADEESYQENLFVLADLYCQGYGLKWERLYGAQRPRRISLPSYPFAKERYWVPAGGRGAAAVAGPRAGALHPLLHAHTSDLSVQRFCSRFDGSEFFLSDHVVQGDRVLPGVAYLEMARAAVARAAGDAAGGDAAEPFGVRFKDVVWVRPLVVGDAAREVAIELVAQDGGEIAYEIVSRAADDAGSEPVLHGQGRAELVGSAEAPVVDLAGLQAACPAGGLSSGAFYQAFAARGIAYGPAHRGVAALFAGSDGAGRAQVLARLELPASVAGTQGDYVLHPSLLDAALQACAGLELAQDAAPGRPLLPFALEEVSIFAPSPPRGWASVRAAGAPGDALQKLDIDLCDDEGRLCVRLRGVTARASDDGIGSAGTLLFKPAWQAQAAVAAAEPDYAQRWVVLCETGERGRQIAGEIEAGLPGARCLVVGGESCEIAARYEAAAVQVLAALQGIVQDKPGGDVLLQVVVPVAGDGTLFAGLSGVMKTARLEHPRLVGQVIGIAAEEPAAGVVARLRESACAPHDQQVRYQAGERLVGGGAELAPAPAAMPAAPPWRGAGVYLISGGAGGLGLIFAREIAERVKQPALILTGRSELSEAGQAALRALQELGARVAYRRVDVADGAAVAGLIAGVGEEFGGLHGIVHSAGVIRDSFLLKKTAAEVAAVFPPKVAGVVNLDAATRDHALDLMVLFASGTGALGNVGQGDYAAANAFLDGYASYRNGLVRAGQRRGRTLSIDWPLWREGGMQVDAAVARLQRAQGIVPLSTQDGIAAFYQALAAGADQVMVVSGQIERLRAAVLRQDRAATVSAPLTRTARAAPSVEAAGELLAKVQAALVQAVSGLLKVRAEDIELETELSEYGFDSISLTKLANHLNASYGLELMPTIFFEHPTFGGFADYLIKHHHAVFARRFGPAAGAVAVQPGEAVAAERAEARPLRRRGGRFARGGEAQERAQHGPEAVAVIGISGQFPMAPDGGGFWRNLVEGRDCIGEIPKERWDWRALYGDPGREANKTNIKWGGFIDGVAEVDPLFFGISPREAELMGPPQRLLMTYVWKAIEDAGYSAASLSGSRTALLIGTGSSGYEGLVARAGVAIEGHSSTGAVPSIGPNRMSYFLNLHGPSEPIETACSSSLVAVHRAMQALAGDSCEMAIAGGINTLLTPEPYISFNKAGMLSQDGRCKTFSRHANGYVRGEGVGMLVLKKLAAAQADGDHIYGVIRASAENHGGRSR